MTPRDGNSADGRHSDFRKLWAALSISLMGSELTALALPLIAALSLGATPLEMGLLAAARELPFLLLSLPAGVWVDRLRRRPVIIVTDLATAALLVSIPIVAWFGGLEFPQLCAAAFAIGALTVVSEVAYFAYVPSLVGRERLTAYNSRLQVSYSVASGAGPGVGGIVIQLVSAPIAILADAATSVVSAVLLRLVRSPEPVPPAEKAREPLVKSAVEGIQMLLKHPLLRPIIVGGGIANIFRSGFLALFVLYAVRDLALDPATVGLVIAAGGIGAIPGALIAERVGRRWGIGKTMITGWTVAAIAALAVPFAAGPALIVVVVLVAAQSVGGLADAVANLHQWSLRQTVTPDRLSGRVTAAHRFVVYGAGATGAIVGGVVGTAFGLQHALVVCAIGMLTGPVVALVSPLRRLQHQPPPAAEQARFVQVDDGRSTALDP